eukprot:gnl/MRDRNA2_/MRDRNA2_104715_c0_seq1.p1 gnl/MRDRNA2_/MRDRNA2_104715_c0~~gnl/MRDRNA2_/MRDRNA2_104715_c0_seq1.p1  ORF type:complete len:346 (+),score=63.30 gnl/MRDRNA2_/MRDRNA2_104715_c0_seq1:81-1118(+)
MSFQATESIPFQNHKLLLKFDHSITSLRRSKTLKVKDVEAALRKSTSVDKARFSSTSSLDDQNDLSENLDDMIQRVSSKIEKLIESTPTDSDQLPNKFEESCCQGHSSDSESGQSSDSEPDPEEPSSPKVERNDIDALCEISFEGLLATCNALLRENQSLKMELAALKAQKTMKEINTQQNDAQSLLKQNEVLTWSSSAKEVTSPAPDPQAHLALPIRSWTPMVSSSKGKCQERFQPVDVGSLSARQPADRAYANSEGPSSPPQNPALSLSARTAAAPPLWEFQEYVQYRKEPMESGWREFYTPRSICTPSRTPSRRGSKSVHVYRRHSASGLALERNLSFVEDW